MGEGHTGVSLMILWGIFAWLCLMVVGGAFFYALKRNQPRDDLP